MGNFIFIIVVILSLVLSFFAAKKNSKILLILVILLLSLMSGFRGLEVGIDTNLYNYAFINNFPYSWQFEENGFRVISMLIMNKFLDTRVVFTFFALVINSLIILRLWDYKEKCSFTFMMFIYMLTFYTDSMNVMRQFIAVSIIFFSTKLLEKKHYIMYLIIVLIMTQIHKTSLLGLALIVVYLWHSLSLSKKILISVPMIIVSGLTILYAINYESAHISNYLSNENYISNINITFLYRLLCFGISWLLYKSNKKIVCSSVKNNSTEITVDDEHKKDFKIISTIYLLGLLFSSVGMFYVVMARLGYYYVIFELLYWGYLVKNSKNKTLNLSLIGIYVIYIFVLEMCTGGNGVFPFSFNL